MTLKGVSKLAKFYIKSGRVELIFDAANALEAAVKAFQWTCDKQATIQAESCVDHARQAEVRGCQLLDEIVVSETGFGRLDGVTLETRNVLYAWQDRGQPIV